MTQQLDLFGSAPAAPPPPKPDTAMLLAMSDDYDVGGETPTPKGKTQPEGPPPDPLGAKIIELGLVHNEFLLSLNSTISPPYDAEYPAPWNLPSRLFRFPIETQEASWHDGKLHERSIGLMHPALIDHPFVQHVQQQLGMTLSPDGAMNAHGYSNSGNGQWWHAVDLMSAGLWRELLDTAHFTTPDHIMQAVEFSVRHKGKLSLKDARHIMLQFSVEPLFDLEDWLSLWMKPSPNGKHYPVNNGWTNGKSREGKQLAWGMIHGIERSLFKYDGDFIGWSDKGRAAYDGERTELL